MSGIILDSEALSRLARMRAGDKDAILHAVIRAAADTESPVVVPAAVLSELYRGPRWDGAIDACLSRNTGIRVHDTTRHVARTIGHLLAGAGRGSSDHVDATVVATAIHLGGAVILTGDADDMTALAAGQVGITIESIA